LPHARDPPIGAAETWAAQRTAAEADPVVLRCCSSRAHANKRALHAPAIIRHVSIKVGGIHVASVTTGAAQEALRELGVLAGPVDLADYVVDLCFLTYVKDGLGSQYAAGVGIRPGMVGRKQRRFIINLEVPPELKDRAGVDVWITAALEEAAAITRAYLPRKSRQYPADRLAGEIDELRTRWVDHAAGAA